jgi:soluble lytic murein transglycosylase
MDVSFKLPVLFLASAFVGGLGCAPALAAIEPVTLTSDDAIPAPRWMFGKGDIPAGDSGWALMAAAKHAQLDNDPETCLKKIDAAWAKAKTAQPWLAVVELDCGIAWATAAPVPAAKVASKTSATASAKASTSAIAGVERLHKALARVEKNPAWLVTGAQTDALRTSLVKGYVTTIEQDVKTDRARAAKSIDRAEELSGYADEPVRAKLWRLAGELAFQNQNVPAARELLHRSLHEFDSDEARIRLTQIESSLDLPMEKTHAVEKSLISPQLESSKEELELVDRVTSALKNGELVSAVDDAVKLIRAFPGGNRAKWAYDRVSDAYWSIAEKSDQKYVLTRAQMLKLMQGADADRINDWAKAMYTRGQWDDSLALSRTALEQIGGARSTMILDLASKAAIATDKFDLARKYLDRLVSQHAGTTVAREALLRSGLLHYRMQEFGQAASDLERLLSLPAIDRLEVSARYWLWRSLQRSKSERTDAAADELLRKFPFSYYGLRARMERSANLLEWKPETGKITAKLWLTKGERDAWERAQLLLRAGWLDEAQAELRELPPPLKAEDKALRAVIWAAAAQFVTASKLANEAWDEVPELRREPLVGAAFPNEFTTMIDAQASARKLDRYLVRGLIKQESGFNMRATSPANALGLMQLVPGTAKEVAGELKLGNLNLPDDMFQPSRNIQMGAYYLAKLVNKYSGHVPLALASYNAGPTRIDRWLRSRPSMKSVALSRSSAPEDELWFDEIPYWETSVYVKSILRNILIYKMLDKGRVQVPDPVWAEAIQAAP